MAGFPYTYQTGFETGAVDTGGALTDSQSKTLGYLHYTESVVKYGVTPFRGAYCWGLDQSVNTTTDIYQAVAAMNVADNSYFAVSGAFYLQGITMAAGARVSIVKNISAAADESTLQLYYTAAGGLQLLLTQADDTAVGSNPVRSISQNEWHTFELYGLNDAQGSGTLYCVIDDIAMGNIGSLTNAAITDTLFGSMDAGAGEFTVGKIFFDDLYCHVDTAAVRFGHKSRYPANPHLSAIASQAYKEHLFVGPGTVGSVALLTAVAGDSIRLYDTDRGYNTNAYDCVAEASIPVATAADNTQLEGPFIFRRGCFAVVTPNGAAGARAQVQIAIAPPEGYPKAIYYHNDANLKRYAHQRKELSGNR